uniref:Metalloendopeptidase n=1 Tax=Acrobeloides nanus TaxID=290746 RepID=A0A914E9E9_9BILA
MLVRAVLLFVLAYIFYRPGTGAPALQIKSLNLLGKIGFTQEKLDRIRGKLSQLNDLVASKEKRPRPLNFQQKVYSDIKRFQEHKGIVEINMDSELAPYFYQGDLLMSDEELDKIIRDYSSRQKRQALSDLTTLWSNPIPYTFSTSYPIDSTTQGYIQTILQWIQNHSCLTFVQDSSAAPHIEYNSESSGCFANSLGKPNNTDPRYVNLGAGCNYGIGHEHERYDRDSYIYLDTNYLASGYLSQFDKYSSLTTTNYNKRYEYGSVMHYYAIPSTNGTPPVPVIDCGSNPTTITTTSSSQGSTTINPIPSNSTCADQETRPGYCDYYKNLSYCEPTSQWYNWSQTWCAKTCGFCPASCADQETRSGYCDYYKGLGYCDPSSQWYSWAQTWCAHTCGFC